MRALLWVRNSINGLLILSSILAIPYSLAKGDGLLAGVAISAGYLMPWYGGMGMRGAFKIGDRGQKLAGFVLGTICLVVGTWLLTLNPFTASAWFWGPLLFGWGFLTVTNKDAKEATSTSGAGREDASPEDPVMLAFDVVAAFGATLEGVSSGPELHAKHPESKLPYPKPVIEAAFHLALEASSDAQMKDQLHVGLILLEDFVPDAEVDDHPVERALREATSLTSGLSVAQPEMGTPRHA